MEKYIGIMSGTSLDGVDTALVETDGQSIQLLAQDFCYPADLKQDVLDVCIGQQTTLVNIGEIDHRLGKVFADAVEQLINKTLLTVAPLPRLAAMDRPFFMRQIPLTLSPCKSVMRTSLRRKRTLLPWQISAAKTWR